MTTLHALIRHGRVESQDPIPREWEGQHVKIVPLTPDDPIPDLEGRLAVLQALGPTEYEPGERDVAAQAMRELDRLSRDAMHNLVSRQP